MNVPVHVRELYTERLRKIGTLSEATSDHTDIIARAYLVGKTDGMVDTLALLDLIEPEDADGAWEEILSAFSHGLKQARERSDAP